MIVTLRTCDGNWGSSRKASARLVSGPIAMIDEQMAVVVLTLVPILLVYPFVQKHFTKGVLLGAIKG